MKHSGSAISLTTSIHTTTGTTPLSSPVKRKRRLSSLATGSFHSIGTRSPTPISSSAASSPLASPFASPNTITKSSTGSRSNNARRVLSLKNSTVTISSPPFSTTATSTNTNSNNTKTNKTNENRLLAFIMTHIRRLLVAALIVTVIEVVQKVTLHHQLVVELSNTANANDSIHAWQPQATTIQQTQTQTMQRNLSQEQQQQQQQNNATTTETLLRQAPPLDVTFLSKRQQPQQDPSACSVAPGHGPEGRMGFQALLKVNIANSTTTKSHQHQPRLLCIVITDSTQHDTILQAIVDTYAPHCDGFMAASNQTDVTLGAVDLFSGIGNLDTNNKNNDDDWTRTKLVWQYVQEHFLHHHNNNKTTTTTTTTMNFDAFSLGQSDTYTIPQNLKLLLSEYYADNNNANTNTNRWRNEPMYVGGAVVPNRQSPEERFCGGGAGYILNALAVQAVVASTTMDDDCAQNPNGFAADRQLATCLYQQQQQQQQPQQHNVIDNNPIQCAKTTDPDSGGGSALRFLEFGIDYQANWNKAVRGPIKAGPLADYHGIFLKASTGGISNKAIGFHLVHGTEALVFDDDGNGDGNGDDHASSYNEMVARTIRRVHAILYQQCTDTWEQPTMAKDEYGTIGYVADPTYLKKHPLTFSKRPGGKGKSICSTPFGEGPEGYYGYQGLQKIEIDKDAAADNNNNNNNKKVLCLIYTHSNRHDRIRAIAETYGAKCDGFLAASNQTDPTIGAVNLLHEGPEAYGNMWLKVRAIWQYVYDNYRNDFDYFHLGGDDHYVIPENLKKMAASRDDDDDDNNQILFMGGSMIDFPHTNIRYCGGGSGYTLNTKALTTFVTEVMPTCRPHFETSQEDRMISNCFRSYLGISCMDTNDELGEARYHQEHVDFHASWTKEIPNVWKADDLETHHGIVSKEGLGQISKTSVSFHLKNAWKSSNAMKKMKDNGVVDDSGIRRYHAILHGLCD